MLRRYKAEQAAEILGIERHMLKPLREHGFLNSTRAGHGFTYDSEELDEFIRMTRGFDMTCPEQIAVAAQIIQPQKNRATLCGRARNTR